MSYTNPDTMVEVANILESFDEDNLQDIFRHQIIDDDGYTDLKINHLAPLFRSYQRVNNMPDVDEDDLENLNGKFHRICLAILNYISSKYNISFDTNWLETNYSKLAPITMCMYQFFVLDIFKIILNALNNYISKNINDLYDAFSLSANSKDVTTITNMKIMDLKYAVIVSTLYDVTDYSFTMMDNESFLDYLEKLYTPAIIIHRLIDDGTITGDFANTIANIYKENLSLRSRITFELINRVRENGYLKYNPLIINRVEGLAQDDVDNINENQLVNTDISDDVD